MVGEVKSVTGEIEFKNKSLYAYELFFDYNIEFITVDSLSEADIDTKVVSLLKSLGWQGHTEIRQRKTNINEIDDFLKSKSSNSKHKGHADIYVLDSEKLRIIIDNKSPKESVEDGINDGIFYANSLLKNGYDIRIILSYNGKNCSLRVYDSETNTWNPFRINGTEINAFPSKELVNLIYSYRNINNIFLKDRYESINISIIIQGLKEIYRNVPFLQNDNQKTIDFTISFIALKSILEKHGSELNKNWSDFENVAEQKVLKEKIKMFAEDIIDNLKSDYEEIFKLTEDPKGKIKQFDFLDVIKQFPNKVEQGEKGHLIKIFQQINKLPHLHSSKFDLFGEVYQSLMEQHTRKIFEQFFTPRHLIKPLIRLFYEDEMDVLIGELEDNKPINPKSICDPACGTGGFLTESFKYFEISRPNIDSNLLAKKSINGFDIYRANTVRSKINMYLVGDGFSRIDSFDVLRRLNENEFRFDYILTNPPFGKGDYVVDKKMFSHKRKEGNFLVKIIKLLRSNGKALIVVPDGILEAPTLNILREFILKNCLVEKIIGLPKHIFAPYTHEKTYVLFLQKRPSEISKFDYIKTERVWMYIVDNDGYANSDKRYRTGIKDKNGKCLHDELSLWKDGKGATHISILEENWRKKVQPTNEKYYDEWGNEIQGQKYGYVEIETILKEEVINYPTVNKKSVLKLLKSGLTENQPINVYDLFSEDEEDFSDGGG